MFDLTEELQGLVHLYRTRADRRRGTVIAFVGVTSNCGVSTCARAFARQVAPNSTKGVWLFDLDFYANQQYAMFSTPQASRLYGPVGEPLDPTLQMEPFWQVSPQLVREDGREVSSAWYLAVHQIGQHRLFVSRFRSEALQDGQSVHVKRAAAYWQKMRDAIDLAVVDVPARDRSRTILALAPDVDGVVLLAEHGSDPNALIALQQEIEASGGTCIGVVYNSIHAIPGAPQQIQQ
ncbi:MAG: hypothetical protein COA47_11350 [Robiginitomaculum sp.]|nr:MAG: hypothetical protein COA47_11350 [Robiginitomaculum sp.]